MATHFQVQFFHSEYRQWLTQTGGIFTTKSKALAAAMTLGARYQTIAYRVKALV